MPARAPEATRKARLRLNGGSPIVPVGVSTALLLGGCPAIKAGAVTWSFRTPQKLMASRGHRWEGAMAVKMKREGSDCCLFSQVRRG